MCRPKKGREDRPRVVELVKSPTVSGSLSVADVHCHSSASGTSNRAAARACTSLILRKRVEMGVRGRIEGVSV